MSLLPSTRRFLARFSLATACLALLVALMPSLGEASVRQNDIVVIVFNEPIYEVDLISDAKGAGVAEYLRTRILGPVLAKYRENYKELLSPQDYEIRAARYHLNRAYLERMIDEMVGASVKPSYAKSSGLAQSDTSATGFFTANALQPPQNQLATAIVAHWKFQRHLYEFYGGGRVAMHAYGPEAIDATVRWLQVREMRGDFRFLDREVRAQFYADWTQVEIRAESLGLGDLDVDQAHLTAGSAHATQVSEEVLEENRQQLLVPQWLEPALPSSAQ